MRRFLTVAFAVALLFTAACGPRSSTSSDDEAKPPHNPSDVDFAQMMIPHHEQAVEMSKLAATNAGSQEVKDLASEIESAQQPEIDTMKGWLKKWGADTMSHDMGHDSMPGMVSESDMDKLKQANGAAFDRLFLTAMIAHHQGAIDMARSEKGDGINPEATKLADAVIKTQTAEIRRMRQMLG